MLDPDQFDPNRWEATADPALAPPRLIGKKRTRTKKAARFLKGPVPWPWLHLAMMLKGRSLAVGLMLWLQSGILNRRTITFCLARAADEGIPATTARRAVRQLEAAGLIKVQRKPGRGLEITILDAPSGKLEAGQMLGG